MPAQGKHRRTRTISLRRGLAAVTTGGAVLALPVIGATSAFAAPAPAAPQAAPPPPPCRRRRIPPRRPRPPSIP